MRRNSPIFSSDHQDHGAGERYGSDVLALRVQANHREPVLGQVLKNALQIAGARNGEMHQSACGSLFHDGSESASTFSRQNQGRRAQADAGTGDRPQIAGILHGCGENDQRRFSVLDIIEQSSPKFVPFDEFPDIADGHHPLMAPTFGLEMQFPRLQLLHRNSMGFSRFLQFVQPGVAGPALE